MVLVPFEAALRLRPLLVALTDALEKRDAGVETVSIDLAARTTIVDSSLDDVDARPASAGWPVPPPDGLWEWRVRRDFVRALPPGPTKTRLGATLGGPKTRRRFEIALDVAGGSLHAAFRLSRRRRLRAYAGRVLRAAIAGLSVHSFCASYPPDLHEAGA